MPIMKKYRNDICVSFYYNLYEYILAKNRKRWYDEHEGGYCFQGKAGKALTEGSKRNVWIGVDVGTTGVRAIAYRSDGTKLASAEAFYSLSTPHPDWAEEDPREVVRATESVIRETGEALSASGIMPQGIALSTIMHTFMPLDKDCQPLAPMMTWADSRSSGIVQELKADAGFAKALYGRTGCPVHACYPFPKILWLKRHQEVLFHKMGRIGSIKDYLFFELTGEWLIDHSTASTSGMYCEKRMDWDEEAIAYLGIGKDMLPRPVSTTHGEPLCVAAASRLNLPAGLPVVIGATDGVLVNVGIGAIRKGQLSATIGTSGAIRMLTEKPTVDERMRTWCYNLVDDIWVSGGAINNGGMILRWVRDEILGYTLEDMKRLGVDAYDLMTMQASHSPAGAGGLLLLPCFTGERAPYWNSDLRGLFFGLSLSTKRADMIRATLEGICFSLKAVYEALLDFSRAEDIRVSGGFTKSPLWMQILANILEHEITLPDNSEGAAYGAAVLGFISMGELSSIADTADLVHPKKIFYPQEDTQQTYRELYRIFEHVYWNLQKEFAEIAAFQSRA